MPELPEVETIKEALRCAIETATINNVAVYNRKFRIPITQNFEESICGTIITKIYRKAKYIIINLNNGYSIIWHLGMSGRIKILDSIPSALEKHDHVVIQTTKGIVVFNDARRFGLMTLTKTNHLNEHALFIHTGIDPFDDKLTANYFFNAIKNKKSAIKLLLLDQHIINGIGNIYASEALYDARISPLKEGYKLSLAETEKLLLSIRKTLTKAIKAGGSTLRDYKKPDGSMGYFQNEHCVYGKTGQRCPDCCCTKKGGIKRIVQSGRSTFYCEHLQK